MSMFSQPMGRNRFGLYNGVGCGVGACTGAILAGRDNRTSGAVVGGVVGGAAGLGVSAYHSYGRGIGIAARAAVSDIKFAAGASQAGRRMDAAGTVAGNFMRRAMSVGPNVTSGLGADIQAARTSVGEGISAVKSMMSRFHK